MKQEKDAFLVLIFWLVPNRLIDFCSKAFPPLGRDSATPFMEAKGSMPCVAHYFQAFAVMGSKLCEGKRLDRGTYLHELKQIRCTSSDSDYFQLFPECQKWEVPPLN
jgi:hypothetical protein